MAKNEGAMTDDGALSTDMSSDGFPVPGIIICGPVRPERHPTLPESAAPRDPEPARSRRDEGDG